MIAALGSIVFEVTSQRVFAPGEIERERRWDHAEHEIVKGPSRLQYLGRRLDVATVKGAVSTSLVDDVRAEIDALAQAADAGTPLAFAVGDRSLGTFVIDNLKEVWTNVDASGRLLRAEFELSLKEFG